MMKRNKNFLKLIGASLALFLVSGSLVGIKSNHITEADAIGNYSTDKNTYYNSITATSGTALLSQLHTLMGETHKYYSSYDDCKTPEYVYAMEPGTSSSYVTDFYTQKDIDKAWGSGSTGTWNREHVWCQSLSIDKSGTQLYGETYAGSDLHHLRPIETTLNSSRNNHPFGELAVFGKNRESNIKKAKNTSGQYTDDGGYYANGLDLWEPLDGVKGDISRILFYVYMHYSNQTGGDDGSVDGHTSDLQIDKIVHAVDPSSSESVRKSAAWKMLLKWNENDPVDNREIVRNEQAAKYQGNRNPFIDHPEYAEAIWGDGTISLNIDKNRVSLQDIGDYTTIKATSSDSKTYSVNWVSSNSSVVTVSPSTTNTSVNTTLTAVGEGEATITGTATISGEQKTVECFVKVGKDPEPVSGSFIKVTQEPTDWSGTYLLAYNSSESQANVWTGIFSKDGTAYISTTVTNNCIENVPEGASTITIKKKTDSTTYSILVNSGINKGKYISGKSSDNDLIFSTDEKQNTITYSSETGNNGILITSNTSVLRFNTSDKCFRYYKSTTYNNQKIIQLYKQTGITHVDGVSLNKESITLDIGDSETLVATVSPADAEDKSVIWDAEDGTVVSVSENGLVTALAEGETTVSVITNDGSYTATCSVTVNPVVVVLDYISVKGPTIFFLGQTFNRDLVVTTAHYSDGTSKVVEGSFEEPDLTTTGKKEVTVSYGGKNTSYFIDVIERSGAFYKVASYSRVDVSNAPENSVANFKNTSQSAGHITKDNDALLTLSGYEGNRINNIYLSMKSNQTSGAGYLIAKRGDTTIATIGSASFNNDAWFGAYVTSYVNLKLDLNNIDEPIKENENITIQIFGTVSSLYIESYTVDYAEVPDLVSISLSNIKSVYKKGETFVKPTVTAHYEDDSTNDVTNDTVFTGNDTSTLGGKTVTASYTEFGITCTTTFTIVVQENSGSSNKYELVTSADSLSSGDKITFIGYIGSGDNKGYHAITPYSGGNNCGTVSVADPVENIITSSSISPLTLGKESNNNYTFYDGTYYLYAAGGTSNNYLKGTNSTVNFNSHWSISIDTDNKANIVALDTGVSKNLLRFNPSNKCFSAYGKSSGGVNLVWIYKQKPAEPSPLQIAQQFAVNLSNSIVCYSGIKEPTISNTTWEELSGSYDELSAEVKTIFRNAEYSLEGTIVTPLGETDSIVANSVAKYDQLVVRYSKTFDDFMDRNPNLGRNPILSPLQNVTSQTMLIVTASIIGLSAVAGYIFYRRRKEQ